LSAFQWHHKQHILQTPQKTKLKAPVHPGS
jgi:hypothetical protein